MREGERGRRALVRVGRGGLAAHRAAVELARGGEVARLGLHLPACVISLQVGQMAALWANQMNERMPHWMLQCLANDGKPSPKGLLCDLPYVDVYQPELSDVAQLRRSVERFDWCPQMNQSRSLCAPREELGRGALAAESLPPKMPPSSEEPVIDCVRVIVSAGRRSARAISNRRASLLTRRTVYTN